MPKKSKSPAPTWTYSPVALALFHGDHPFATVTHEGGESLDARKQAQLLAALNESELRKVVDAVAFDLEVCARSESLNVAEVCRDWAKRLRKALR